MILNSMSFSYFRLKVLSLMLVRNHGYSLVQLGKIFCSEESLNSFVMSKL